jgi:hypothetical protein
MLLFMQSPTTKARYYSKILIISYRINKIRMNLTSVLRGLGR